MSGLQRHGLPMIQRLLRAIAPFSTSPHSATPTASWMLWGLIAVCCLIEAVLSLADANIIGPVRLRAIVYEYGGFWPGLLANWTPNYSIQPYAMFLTYGFLHGGLSHLVLNMLTLWSFGRHVIARVGTWGFCAIYAASILGGGLGYALLTSGPRPMVGASGALFGLIGAILAWNYVDRFSLSDRLWPVARAVLLLIAFNLILWWAMDGQLAWETHLGGFVLGWFMATLIDPRSHPQDDAAAPDDIL